MNADFRIRVADWEREREAMRAVRTEVFIQEQHILPQDEWDELDPLCVHLLALDAEGAPVGTGRLTPDGQIGRMAVLKARRGRGIGTALLRTLLDSAQQRGLKACRLNAQDHAIGFYARHGFTVYDEGFLEGGIPHRRMRKDL
ncbi:MAG TPA: GNAT family N-acetyltransferase [Gammaproteobacteria bacterium]|jgi:predicted GNAT family N-acyltransferase|nr:GNAT family N-acetyltransferase [Gammaproteobacteria bacterium]